MAVIGMTGIAQAAPPDGANPIYAPFYQSLKLPGYGDNYCCTIADCRPVLSRNLNGQWEAYIDKKTFGDDPRIPDAWVPVPPETFTTTDPKKEELPRPDSAVACFYQGTLRCFTKPMTLG